MQQPTPLVTVASRILPVHLPGQRRSRSSFLSQPSSGPKKIWRKCRSAQTCSFFVECAAPRRSGVAINPFRDVVEGFKDSIRDPYKTIQEINLPHKHVENLQRNPGDKIRERSNIVQKRKKGR